MPRLPFHGRSRPIGSLQRCRRGATAIEYGLMAALIAIAIVGGISALGTGGRGMWAMINSKMPTVG